MKKPLPPSIANPNAHAIRRYLIDRLRSLSICCYDLDALKQWFYNGPLSPRLQIIPNQNEVKRLSQVSACSLNFRDHIDAVLYVYFVVKNSSLLQLYVNMHQ